LLNFNKPSPLFNPSSLSSSLFNFLVSATEYNDGEDEGIGEDEGAGGRGGKFYKKIIKIIL
jgi:hypothetical protein